MGSATKIYSPTKWRGKKKLQNIRNISNIIENDTCDIHKLISPCNTKITYNNFNKSNETNISEKRCVVVVSNNNYFHKAKKNHRRY